MGSGEGSKILHTLYRLSNIARAIKCRILRWAGHVARKEEGRNAFKILTGKPTGTKPSGRIGIDGRTVLKWTIKK